MLAVLSLVMGFWIIAALFLPWNHRRRIQALEEDVSALRSDLEKLEHRYVHAIPQPSQPAAPAPASTPSEPVKIESVPIHVPKASTIPPASPWSAPPAADSTSPSAPRTSVPAHAPAGKIYEKASPTKETPQDRHADIEERFGARLPVWIGGVALALAGFYFVKYSIDAGWLRPVVRIIIGMAAGLAALGVADAIRRRPDFANGTRIAQAVTGAGLADLYGCIFAATNLYHLIPPLAGFAGMAVVTAAAVLLSLRHGAPIALLGLVGGFLTPALIGSPDPSAPALFTYLYVTMTGLLVVMRKQGWWLLSMLAVAASFFWVVLWMLGSSLGAMDTLVMGTFVIAVTFTAFALVPSQGSALLEGSGLPSWMETTMVVALALMCGVLTKGQFGMMEWALFGLLAAGGIALAYFKQELYGRLPGVCAGVTAVMLLLWRAPEPQDFALLIVLFGALYTLSGLVFQSRSAKPLPWSMLAAFSGLGYFLLAYARLRQFPVESVPHFWGILAFALAAVYVGLLAKIRRDMPQDHAQRDAVFAVFAAAATAFVSLGLCMEIDNAFLPVAIAGEFLALAWINTRVDVKSLRRISAIVMAVSMVLLMPQAAGMVSGLMGAPVHGGYMRLAADAPMFHFGLPALLFAAASLLLRRQQDGRMIGILETTSIFLGMIALLAFARQIMYPSAHILDVRPDFIERGVMTNLLFAYSLLCLWLGSRYARPVVSQGGRALFMLAAARIGYYDLLTHNPLLRHESVGGLPVLNALLVTYGLPIFWISRAGKYLSDLSAENKSRSIYGMMLLLSFILLSFEVRQLFHGEFLDSGQTSSAEIYTYSAGWLLYGLALLFVGTLRNNKMIRAASLVIMVPTVAKVFLYDAAALEGLYRVFSFFGLGLSLLGLSWFYSRFVFQKSDQ